MIENLYDELYTEQEEQVDYKALSSSTGNGLLPVLWYA